MLTLTFTVIAYKLSMSSAMPTITYLTSIDKYQVGRLLSHSAASPRRREGRRAS
jgi:hypothetical protein